MRWSRRTVLVPDLLSAVPERNVLGAADCVLATGPIARLPFAALRASTISSTEFIIFCRRAASAIFSCVAASTGTSGGLGISPDWRNVSMRCSSSRRRRPAVSFAILSASSACATRARCALASSANCLIAAGGMFAAFFALSKSFVNRSNSFCSNLTSKSL